jgi:hypothetical protein
MNNSADGFSIWMKGTINLLLFKIWKVRICSDLFPAMRENNEILMFFLN